MVWGILLGKRKIMDSVSNLLFVSNNAGASNPKCVTAPLMIQ